MSNTKQKGFLELNKISTNADINSYDIIQGEGRQGRVSYMIGAHKF